jgi:uncharacterized protein YheU (UPF0270 family)
MKRSVSILIILLLPMVAAADWICISLESAVRTSDLIVIGTLANVSEWTKDGTDYGSGEITIDEVLSGKAKPGQKLSLVWQNESNVLCPRVEHRDNQNRQRIWLLELKPENKVAADNPCRVVPVDNRNKVIDLLREAKQPKKSLR